MKKIRLFSISITDMSVSDLYELYLSNAKGDKKVCIGHVNLHTIYQIKKSSHLHSIFNSIPYVYIDGTPISKWISLVSKGRLNPSRFTMGEHLDEMLLFLEKHDLSLFFLGANPELEVKIKDKINALYPSLRFEGHHGYFLDWEMNQKNGIIDKINEFSPNLLLIGMGTPHQEFLANEWKDKIKANTIHCIGASFDYYIGEKSLPPKWAGPLGLQWVFRFLDEPQRLFFRYFIEPIFLIPLFIKSFWNCVIRGNKLD